ncbi:hypothetical protein OU415_25265 [Saccharopolyspora sp. WRP15-2]|uniref:Uncharacterized protein n=1 Tax=Saccharopolyspora oryzae TaxID=2997343 RepID=A0ABT4V465_9PSEU|nr:hypothetical protein [Saccharopolyspora oryzae]MDA3628767.1 hypothetical protein [Saccharopolyspora oryzae]
MAPEPGTSLEQYMGGHSNPAKPGAGEYPVALGRSYDILLHLNTITAAELRFR